jgi:hypothetical protein
VPAFFIKSTKEYCQRMNRSVPFEPVIVWEIKVDEVKYGVQEAKWTKATSQALNEQTGRFMDRIWTLFWNTRYL